MKNAILFFAVFISISTSFSQLHLDSLSRVDYSALHGTQLNDVWGYADGNGNEYALVGTQDGLSVVDVSDPQNPSEVFWGMGLHSIWRDMKTWDHYAYVTTEAENGLYIVDLGTLPGNTNLSTGYYFGGSDPWSSAHNIYIDSSGYAYIFGANRGNGGVIILDVHTNPMNPVEVGTFDDWYAHDGYVLGDTLYAAHINDGFISVVDVSDKSNPVLLGTRYTPSDFAHNVWPRDDGQVVYTTDEISGAYVASYDVSDPTNITELDRVQSSPGAGVIPHNVHVLGNFLVTSYYSDGIVVFDATHPENLIEVARYDTYPQQTTSYDGCWGAYPFLPSGIILASDITGGLFVLGPEYVQAGYLQGIVTESGSGTPLSDVTVSLTGNAMEEQTASTGFYATGMVDPQTTDVTYSKVGYYPQTVSVSLTSGVVNVQDIQLEQIPQYSLSVVVQEAGSGTPIDNAQVKLVHPLITHAGPTNGLGQEDLVLYYEDTYHVVVAKWGYKEYCADLFIDDVTGTITVELEPGYYDDFEFDLGWTVVSTASTGKWERGIPFHGSPASPFTDADFDCGDHCYITGNSETMNADLDDVDGGVTRLTSPLFDLSTYSDPHINFACWFYNFFGPQPPADDTLRVILGNGVETLEIFKKGSSGDTAYWEFESIRVLDFMTPTTTMTLSVRTSDLDPAVNITEAAFDFFNVSEYNVLNVPETEQESVTLYPNPAEDWIALRGISAPANWEIVDMHGRVICTGKIGPDQKIAIAGLKPGIYLLRCQDRIFRFTKD